jgi:hypothetical protein
MKRSTLAIALFAVTAVAAGQEYPSPAHQQTTTNPGSRFELLQSPLAAKWTFRLDRFTGRVWQLVKTTNDDNTWEEMPVIGVPKLQSATRARFQLFTSGLAARHTFLLDSDTGKTWVVVTGKGKNKDGSEYEYNAWQSFVE